MYGFARPQATAIFGGPNAGVEEDPTVKLDLQGDTEQKQQEEEAQKQRSAVEPKFEDAAGVVNGIERVGYVTENAATNPEAVQEVLRLLEAGRTAGVGSLAVYRAIFKVCCLSCR